MQGWEKQLEREIEEQWEELNGENEREEIELEEPDYSWEED
jgi:hypothetical protein